MCAQPYFKPCRMFRVAAATRIQSAPCYGPGPAKRIKSDQVWLSTRLRLSIIDACCSHLVALKSFLCEKGLPHFLPPLAYRAKKGSPVYFAT